MTYQSRLTYLTKITFEKLKIPSILAVKAFWTEQNLIILTIYLSEMLSESHKEEIEDEITEIIAQFEEGIFQIEYVLMSKDTSLPEQLAFKGNLPK